MAERLRSQARAAYQRLLTLSLPETLTTTGDRERAEELIVRLEGLSEEMRSAVVQVAEEYQTWHLCERVCLTSVQTVSRDLESGAAWARLAVEIAERVRGPEEFRNRIQGYALAHVAGITGLLPTLSCESECPPEKLRLGSVVLPPEFMGENRSRPQPLL